MLLMCVFQFFLDWGCIRYFAHQKCRQRKNVRNGCRIFADALAVIPTATTMQFQWYVFWDLVRYILKHTNNPPPGAVWMRSVVDWTRGRCDRPSCRFLHGPSPPAAAAPQRTQVPARLVVSFPSVCCWLIHRVICKIAHSYECRLLSSIYPKTDWTENR